MFSCEFYEISKNFFSTEHLQRTAFADAHKENCVLLNSVQEFIYIEPGYFWPFSYVYPVNFKFYTFDLKSTAVWKMWLIK